MSLNQLKVKNDIPMGMAWVWVKASFAIFREKPINFLYFGLMLVVFAFLPFMGSFFATLVTMRIILSANYVETEQPFGLNLNFGMILRQKNLFSFAIFNLGLDFIMMSIVSEAVVAQGGDPSSLSTLLANPNLIYIMFAANVFKIVFIGIAPAIMVFNHDVGIFSGLKLSWTFIVKNLVVLVFAVFLLLPFIVIPLYLFSILAISMTNPVAFGLVVFVLLILLLIAINIVSIFGFKIYKDCITHD